MSLSDPKKTSPQVKPLARQYTATDPTTGDSVTFDWFENRQPEEHDLEAVFQAYDQRKSSTGDLPKPQDQDGKQKQFADESRARVLITESERIKADPKIQGVVKQAESINQALDSDPALQEYSKQVQSFQQDFPDYEEKTKTYAGRVQEFDRKHPELADKLAFMDRVKNEIERDKSFQDDPEARQRLADGAENYNRLAAEVNPLIAERERILDERRREVPEDADQRAQDIQKLARTPEVQTGLSRLTSAKQFYEANKESIDYYRRVQEGIQSIPSSTFTKVAFEGERGEKLMAAAEKEIEAKKQQTREERLAAEEGVLEDMPFSGMPSAQPGGGGLLSLIAVASMKPEQRERTVQKIDAANALREEEHLLNLASRQLELATIVPRTEKELAGVATVAQGAVLKSAIPGAKRVAADIETYLPFIGSQIEAGYNSRLFIAQEKAKADPSLESLTPGEQELLKAADIAAAYEGSRPMDWAAKAVLGVAGSIPWMIEIGLTQNWYRGVTFGMYRTLTRSMDSPMVVRRIMATTMGRATQAAVNIPRTELQYTQLRLEGLGHTEALWKSFIMNQASYAAEMAGDPIGKVGSRLMKNLMATWTRKQVSQEVAQSGVAAWLRSGALFHGFGPEVLEEELEYVLHQTILGRQIQWPFKTDEGTERLIDEAIAIGFMSGGFKGVDFGVRGIGKIVGHYDAKAQEKRLRAMDIDFAARYPSVRVRDIRADGEQLGIETPSQKIAIPGFGSLEEVQEMDRETERLQKEAQAAQEQRQRTLRGVPVSKVRPVENVPSVPASEQELREDLVAAGVPEADVVRMTEPELRNRWKQEAGQSVTETEKAEAILSKPENLINPFTGQEESTIDALRRRMKVTQSEARSILQKLGKQVRIPKKTSEMSLEDFGQERVQAARGLMRQYQNVTLNRLQRELGVSPQEARRLRDILREEQRTTTALEPSPEGVPADQVLDQEVKITEEEESRDISPPSPTAAEELLPLNVRNKLARELGLDPNNLPTDQQIINMAEQRGIGQEPGKTGTLERIQRGSELNREQTMERWQDYKRQRTEAVRTGDMKLASELSLIKEEVEGSIMKQRGWKEHRVLTASQIESYLRGERPASVRDLFSLRDKINERGRYTGRADDIRDAEKLAAELGVSFRMESGTNQANLYSRETGKKMKAPGPEENYGSIEEGATLLKDLSPGTVDQIQKILYNVGSDLDIANMNRAQVEAAIRDIKVDAGQEATKRAQLVIEELLSSIDAGAVRVKVPGGKTDVPIDEMVEVPPGEFPEEEEQFTPGAGQELFTSPEQEEAITGGEQVTPPANRIVAETKDFRVETDENETSFVVRNKRDGSFVDNNATRTAAFRNREEAIAGMNQAQTAEDRSTPKPGEPKRFIKTKAGDQGVMDIDMGQRSQEGLGGIKSKIPAKDQIDGTPLFTKPATPQGPGLFEGEKKVTDEEATKSVERIKKGFKDLFGPETGGALSLTAFPIDPAKLEKFFADHKEDFVVLWNYVGQKADEFLKQLAELPDDVKNYVLDRVRQGAAPETYEGNISALQPPAIDDVQDFKITEPEKQKQLLQLAEHIGRDIAARIQMVESGRDVSQNPKHNARSIQKVAATYGITDPTEIKEAVERGIIMYANELALDWETDVVVLANLVKLYNEQPTLSARSSQSVALQQYSTPVPISYIMQLYTGTTQKASTFEPTAGNGMLMFAADPALTYSNEIDPLRRFFLSQLTKNVTADDATQPFEGFGGKFDAVLANPPFGGIQPMMIDGYRVTKLEHLITINALQTMKDSGRAAILIGGHSEYDNKGRLKKDRTFMNWLYHNYNVVDVINVNGDLYRKQGAAFPIRVILINGRKDTSEGITPLRTEKLGSIVDTFDGLFERMNEVRNETLLRPEDFSKQEGSDPLFRPSPGRSGSESGELRGLPPSEAGKPGRASGERGQRPVGDAGGMVGRRPARQSDAERGGAPDPREQFNEEPFTSFPTEIPSAIPDANADVEGRRGERTERPQPRVDLGGTELDVTYRPFSKSHSVTSVAPKNMSFDMYKALHRFQEENGDIDDYVRRRLGYASNEEMWKGPNERVDGGLAGEQVDGLALAIANIERGGSFIIGDQGGMGKGRIAGGLIRYAVRLGLKPVFITQKKHLFNDMVARDLPDIGSGNLRPFVVNNSGIENQEDGSIIHEPLNLSAHDRVLKTGDLTGFDLVVMTYSQIANEEKASTKRAFLDRIAQGNILIMDESHSSSGNDSNTSVFVRGIVPKAKAVTFLSATFAKRPDNMPLYAIRSSLSDANMTQMQLVTAFEASRSAIALQEMVSADMASAGDMIRRERTFDGVNIDYRVLTKESQKHRQIYDQVAELIRDIVDFQDQYVRPVIEHLDDEAAGEGADLGLQAGVSHAGVDNTPFASTAHNVIEQMLFAIKVDAIVEEAISLIKQNKKPIIAVRNTMESFLKDQGVGVGESLENGDFSLSLLRGLKNSMKIRKTDATGKKTSKILEPEELGPIGAKAYRALQEKIRKSTSGIPVSPIDYMLDKFEKAGYKFGEVTGRKEKIIFKEGKPFIDWREERDVTTIFRKFNNGEYVGMILNAAGGTGTSAHASKTFKDQRQRVMIIHQVELDISQEVQKRYRILRTGQVVKPAYVYVTSDIPAETRPMMVLKTKMRKLDANTTSSQKSSLTVQISDFMNKYGDQLVIEFLKENPSINFQMLDPFKMEEMNEGERERLTTREGAANKVTGRGAIFLTTEEQEAFYREINERYDDLISYLNEAGLNDLEVKTLPLNARTISTKMLIAGTGKPSPFGLDTFLEELEIDVLRKPMLKKEIDAAVAKTLAGMTPGEYSNDLMKKFRTWFDGYREERMSKLRATSSVADAERKLDALFDHVNEQLRNFLPGSAYAIPMDLEGKQNTFIHSVGIFLGFDIKEDRKNPFLPSAIKMRFAVADSRRQFSLPLSRNDEVMSIIWATRSARQLAGKAAEWDKQAGRHTRERRLFVTGNILQSQKEEIARRGQFVSFTMHDGSVKRGIMLPHTAEAKINATGTVNVPLSRAKDFIIGLKAREFVETADGQVKFERVHSSEWGVSVPKTKKRGGKYFLHSEILKLTKTGGFDSKGDTMRATVSHENMGKLLDILSDEFRQSIMMNENRLLPTDFHQQGPVTLGMGLIPFVSMDEIKSAWKKMYGFFAHSTTELPLEDVKYSDGELRHLTKQMGTKAKFSMKMLAAPNWTAEKYPGFGSTYLRGRVLREGIWETMVRYSIHEYNENQRSIEIDILNEWRDVRKLTEAQWNNLARAIKSLNEDEPVNYNLSDEKLKLYFGFDDVTLTAWNQMRGALDHAFEFRLENDRYKILKGHAQVTPADVKKYVTEDALIEEGLDEDAIADVLKTIKENFRAEVIPGEEQRKGIVAPPRVFRRIWAIEEVRRVVAEALVEAKKAQMLSNFFPLSRPSDHKWFVLAENPGQEEGPDASKLPPYLASFGSAAEADKHAKSLSQEGYKPLFGGGRTWTFIFKEKRLQLDDEQLQKWRYEQGLKKTGEVMSLSDFEEQYKPVIKDHIVSYNADKNLPESILRQLPLEQFMNVAESVGIDSNNEAIRKVAKEMMAMRGFDRHLIHRERAPGFQYTKENVTKAVTEYIDSALRHHFKYVAMAEARDKLNEIRSELPPKLVEFIEAWLTGYTQAKPEEWHLLRQVIYVTTLGNSLTFFVQNLTQPFLTTMNEIPIMLREADIKGFKGIGEVEKVFWGAHKYAKAWYLWKAGKVLGKDFETYAPKKEWRDILERLRRRGVIQPLQFEEIGGFLKDPRRRYVYGGKTRRFVKRSWIFFADAVGLGSRFTELDNRTHAAMVALIIGEEYLGLKGDDLMIYAERTIKRTQFPYGRHALPPILYQIKGNRVARFLRQVASLLLILRSFAIQYLSRWFYVFRSGSPSAILRMLTASFALAGIRALTPFNGILGTFLSIAYALAGDDEPYEVKERRILSKIEKDLGLPRRFLTTGPIGAFAGVETSRLLGVGDIIPREIGELGGIVPSMFERGGRAIKALGRGDIESFLESAPGVPRQPAAIFRGRRFEREGVVGRGGNVILPKKKLTPYDIAATKLGFTPTSVYDAYEKNYALSRMGRSRVMQYYDFKDRYVRAIMAGDQERKSEIIRDVIEYNKGVEWFDQIDIANLIMASMKEKVGMPPLDKYIQKRQEYERIFNE